MIPFRRGRRYGRSDEAEASRHSDRCRDGGGRLLNDERYAGHFVEYHRQRGHGPERIRRDLEAAGVATAFIDAALATASDWAALARSVRSRRFGPALPENWQEKGRQARFLQYRGFSNDHIRSALGPDVEPDA